MRIAKALVNRHKYAGTPTAILMFGVFEYLALHQVFVLLVGSIYLVAGALANDKTLRNSISEAILLTLGSFAFLFLIVRQFEISNSGYVYRIAILLLFLTSAVLRIRRRQTMPTSTKSTIQLWCLVGPVVVIAATAYFIGRYGMNFAWAMSGDSRNHLHVARETVDAGGMKAISGYPALANAIVGIFGNWHFELNAPGLGELGKEIRILAFSYVVFILGIGLLAGRLVGQITGKHKYMLAVCAAAASCVPLSQLWLHNFLTWGFLPIGLTLVLLLAAVEIALDEERSTKSFVMYMALAAGLVVLTFPPAAPLIAGPSLIAVVHKLTKEKRLLLRKLVVISLSIVPSAALWLLAENLPFRSTVFAKLNLYGSITSINRNALWFLAIPLAVIAIFGRARSVFVSCIGLSICSIGLVLDHYLRGILETTYYIEKLRWVTVVLVIIVTIVAVAAVIGEVNATAMSWVAFGLLPIVLFGAFGNVFQKSEGNSVVRSFVQGWNHPSAADARKIIEINKMSPRSVQWRTNSDFVAAQISNMWQVLGINESDHVILWPFRADQFSLPEVCSFARKHAPVAIWVVNEEVATAVRALCKYEGVTSLGIDSIPSFIERK